MKFQEDWEVLVCLGFQYALQNVQAIIKHHDKLLPIEDESWNATIVSNRMIEKIFISQNFG